MESTKLATTIFKYLCCFWIFCAYFVSEALHKIQISVRRLSSKGEASVSKKRSCSTLAIFNSGTDCIFCEQLVDFSGKWSLRSESVTVKTDTFSKTMLEICKKRNDMWYVDVQGCLAYFEGDLHAADCVYHQSCSENFRNRKGIPSKYKNM